MAQQHHLLRIVTLQKLKRTVEVEVELRQRTSYSRNFYQNAFLVLWFHSLFATAKHHPPTTNHHLKCPQNVIIFIIIISPTLCLCLRPLIDPERCSGGKFMSKVIFFFFFHTHFSANSSSDPLKQLYCHSSCYLFTYRLLLIMAVSKTKHKHTVWLPTWKTFV